MDMGSKLHVASKSEALRLTNQESKAGYFVSFVVAIDAAAAHWCTFWRSASSTSAATLDSFATRQETAN